jgi:hypothetical protein
MLAGLLAAHVAVAGVSFDMTSVLALMYPGRDRVEVSAQDGKMVVYACKPGPAGETPQEQAAKAQAAFEENVQKFTKAIVADMMLGIEEEKPQVQAALDLSFKMQSWAGANWVHLEKEHGCALLG